MPIRFISRITKVDEKQLGFYIPKYVIDFYSLKVGGYRGGISHKHGEVNTCPVKLKKYKNTLKGVIPPDIGKKNAIVEVWIYRDTWIAPKGK